MATQTPNLGLKKPAGSDYVLIGDFNDNADIIDATTGKLSNLNTTIKTNLVLAINEAAQRGGENAPFIDVDTLHWMMWDVETAQYVDSGVKAEGADGSDGADGISAFVWIKWSAIQPTQNSDMKDTPDQFIGIYSGTSPTAPTAYTSYQWYKYKGEQGIQGIQGVQGEQGPRGEQGIQGVQGEKGDTGEQGPKGDTGEKGDTGTGLQIKGTYATLAALQAAITDPAVGDMYNVGTSAPYTIYMWDTTDTPAWVSQGQLEGPQGPAGPKGDTGATGETGATGAQGETGPAGPAGQDGADNNWYTGSAITGTSTTPTAYTTGIETAQVGDLYLNTATGVNLGNVYSCTTGGDDTTALWAYVANIKGADGTGSGTVSSVDGVSPDNAGNVALSALRYVVQSLDSAQQTQARSNIGAQANITANGILKGNGTAISAATAGTDYAPPLVFQTVDGTSVTAVTLADNTQYNVTGVTTITFTLPTATHYHCHIIMTMAATGSYTVTFTTLSGWLNDAPTWVAGATYEVDILDGVAVFGEVATS